MNQQNLFGPHIWVPNVTIQYQKLAVGIALASKDVLVQVSRVCPIFCQTALN